MNLTKEETEFFIQTLEKAEDSIAELYESGRESDRIFLCNVVEDIVGYYKATPLRKYIRSWFEGYLDIPSYSAAPYHKFDIFVRGGSNLLNKRIVNFAKLVWLDFMLLELYDHLDTVK